MDGKFSLLHYCQQHNKSEKQILNSTTKYVPSERFKKPLFQLHSQLDKALSTNFLLCSSFFFWTKSWEGITGNWKTKHEAGLHISSTKERTKVTEECTDSLLQLKVLLLYIRVAREIAL